MTATTADKSTKTPKSVKKSLVSKSYSEALASLNSSNKSNLVLVGVLAAMTYMLFIKEPLVIVTPSTITEEITVQGDQVSTSYKVLWANTVADNLGNVTPNNVEFKKDALGKMLSPRIRHKYLASMESHAAKLKLTGATETFYIQDIYHSETQDITYAYGRKEIKLKGRTPQEMSWTFEMRVGAKRGQPNITYLRQYPGTPKNLKSKTHKVDEQLYQTVDDLKAMERPLNETEQKVVTGDLILVGDEAVEQPIDESKE